MEYIYVTMPYSAAGNIMVYNGTRHQLRNRPTMLLIPYIAVSLAKLFTPLIVISPIDSTWGQNNVPS